LISQSIYDQFPDVLPDTSTMHKKWVWKEDLNSLEQVSTGNQSTLDKQFLAFAKGKKTNKANAKKMSLSNQRKKMEQKADRNLALSPKPSLKVHTNEKRAVTLKDIKSVAFDLLSESGELPGSFQESLRNNQFDGFIAVTLYYFDMFLQKIALDNKPKTMATEPSSSEKKAALTAMRKMELAQNILAERYSSLILGLESKDTHHMGCGSNRKSFTKKDRIFYETLYSYCCFIIWITFRRCDLEIIQKEMGRLFRSNSFNPYSQPINKNDFQLASELTTKDIHDIKLASPSLRKNKRPAISTIINQRSPVMVSLLPTPKDSGAWLLNRRQQIPKVIRAEKEEEEIIMNIQPSNVNVGIIGEIISGFNPFTLAPFGDDGEGEEDSEEEEDELEEDGRGSDEKLKSSDQSFENE